MLVDYYSILGVDKNASQEEITFAYRRQSLKWHPDKNPKLDTTREMQDINEAYNIIGNPEKRARYDLELRRYYEYRAHQSDGEKQYNANCEQGYKVYDEQVKDDIREAKAKAKSFVENLQKTCWKAINGAWEECKIYVYTAIIMTIVSLLMLTCV